MNVFQPPIDDLRSASGVQAMRRARPSMDEYLMEMAFTASSRGTCDRKLVGAVLARNGHILATGYNGSMPGAPHCDEAGHDMEDGHCVRTTHAEQNAILQAARNGVSVAGAICYVTCSPCWLCFKMLVGAGVIRIVYGEAYRLSPRVTSSAAELGIALHHLENTDARPQEEERRHPPQEAGEGNQDPSS